MRRKLFTLKWLLPLCYGAAALVYLAVCLAGYLGLRAGENEGLMPRQSLTLEDFTLEGVRALPPQNGLPAFITTDADPQLIYAPPGGARVGRVTFAATANKPGGELVLYYTTAARPGYSEENKQWARQAADGSWYFDLGGREVTSIRLDPGTRGGVIWTVERMVLNDARPTASYFVPTAGVALLLLVVPGLAAAALAEGAGALAGLAAFFRRPKGKAGAPK